ncbi:hypothetical protein CF327_g3708 [Tilletia walkeri]|nr:hypothetical protein CF327_g3708 [Tilletia walkeri]
MSFLLPFRAFCDVAPPHSGVASTPSVSASSHGTTATGATTIHNPGVSIPIQTPMPGQGYAPTSTAGYAAASKLGHFSGQMPSALRGSNASAVASRGRVSGSVAGSHGSKSKKQYSVKGDKIWIVLDRSWYGHALTDALNQLLDTYPQFAITLRFDHDWSAEQVSEAVVETALRKGIVDFRPKDDPNFEWARLENGSRRLAFNGEHNKYNALELKAEYQNKHAYVVVRMPSNPHPAFTKLYFEMLEETLPATPSASATAPQTAAQDDPCDFCGEHWPREYILNHVERCPENVSTIIP